MTIKPKTEFQYHCYIIEWEINREKYRSELSFYASDDDYKNWVAFNEMIKRERLLQELTKNEF